MVDCCAAKAAGADHKTIHDVCQRGQKRQEEQGGPIPMDLRHCSRKDERVCNKFDRIEDPTKNRRTNAIEPRKNQSDHNREGRAGRIRPSESESEK